MEAIELGPDRTEESSDLSNVAHRRQPFEPLAPRGYGEQVLQRLRDDPVTASVPVVIVSADATAGHVQRLLSAGAIRYLTKPVDVPALLQLLDDTLATDDRGPRRHDP